MYTLKLKQSGQNWWLFEGLAPLKNYFVPPPPKYSCWYWRHHWWYSRSSAFKTRESSKFYLDSNWWSDFADESTGTIESPSSFWFLLQILSKQNFSIERPLPHAAFKNVCNVLHRYCIYCTWISICWSGTIIEGRNFFFFCSLFLLRSIPHYESNNRMWHSYL